MLLAPLQMPGSSGSSGFARCGRRRTQGAGIETRGVECHGAALSRSDGGSQRSTGHRGGRALWSFTQDGPHLEASLSRGRSAGSRGSLASTAPPSLAALGGDRSAHLQAPQGTSPLGAAQAASRTRQTWRRPASVVVERLSRPGEKFRALLAALNFEASYNPTTRELTIRVTLVPELTHPDGPRAPLLFVPRRAPGKALPTSVQGRPAVSRRRLVIAGTFEVPRAAWARR